MSYISESISNSLNPFVVGRKYGLIIDNNGRCKCLFHGSNSKTMMVYNKIGGHYHCFSCNAHGDSIGLVKGILNVDYNDAVKILDKDFNLNMIGSESAEKAWVSARIKQESKSVAKYFTKQDRYDALLDQHRKYHQTLKENPDSWENMTPEFIQALQNIDEVRYKLSIIENEIY